MSLKKSKKVCCPCCLGGGKIPHFLHNAIGTSVGIVDRRCGVCRGKGRITRSAYRCLMVQAFR